MSAASLSTLLEASLGPVLLDTDTGQVVALSAAGLAVLSLGFSVALLTRVRKLAHAHDVLTGGDRGATFVESVTRQHREVEGMRRDVGHLREDLASARADLSDALRHVAVVRYDAFGDMGGRLSFSAALLDDAGDGLVLTSINGRSEVAEAARRDARHQRRWRRTAPVRLASPSRPSAARVA